MVSKSLELPDGYQRQEWYPRVQTFNKAAGTEVHIDTGRLLRQALEESPNATVFTYTQHQIFYEDGVYKQTRSSPNWEGGIVTYATCKHRMRTFKRRSWRGVWIMGLCPKACNDNAVLFCGRVYKQFPHNLALSKWIKSVDREAYNAKRADLNPRGDLYTPLRQAASRPHSHRSYREPPNHTRSVEFYDKSPGSRSTRKDGKIPKWYRDLEYVGANGTRPPVFVLSPCWVFTGRGSVGVLHTRQRPGRATLRSTGQNVASSLVIGR